MLSRLFSRSICRSLFSSETKSLQAIGKYQQKYSKARTILRLYNLNPIVLSDVFIAPNATIAGEVFIGHEVSIWHGTVIRGDINAVMIHTNIFIGNNCVLHTAASTTSGLPATLQIQDDCVIQNGCTLYSCLLKQRSFIGFNSVILEGAIIQQGAIIAPNSVVPPGRVVPAMQVWGGNPIKFIRHVREQQSYVTTQVARQYFRNTHPYREQFLAYNNSYLYKQNQTQDHEFDIAKGTQSMEVYKQTLVYNPLHSTLN